ncbi:MAG: VOC family protein [Gemmatimonadaceae bacterium]
MPIVDHLVYATPDLSRGIEELEQLLGVLAAPGGQHPGLGTRNALIALGPDAYLEIVGPDPAQPTPSTPRWFGIDELEQSRLVTWAAKGTNLEHLRAQAVKAGIPLGAVARGGRRRPDGVELSWEVTNPRAFVADGIVPFFIDWGQSPHPAQSAAKGASLVGLRAEHPDAPRVHHMLQELELPVAVRSAAHVALVATIDCPRGRVDLTI